MTTDFNFAELQQLALTDESLEKVRLDLDELTDYMRNLDYQEEQMSYFAEMRQLSMGILRKSKSFMVLDNFPRDGVPEKFRHDMYGFVKGSYVVYDGRYVFPVLDPMGHTMGYLGYDKFESPKYLDSKTVGYKAKNTTMFGMEDMAKYYDDKYVFVTEGPICALWLRDNGLNALSLLGSSMSPYVTTILKRFGAHCIIVPDNDLTGTKAHNTFRRKLPLARIIHTRDGKDIDDTRMVNPDIIGKLHDLAKNPYAHVYI
jgi:DNA primase